MHHLANNIFFRKTRYPRQAALYSRKYNSKNKMDKI